MIFTVLASGLLIPAQAMAQTEVRVYWGVGFVIGGVSVFLSFGSGDLSENETDIETADSKHDENQLLAKAITKDAEINPTHYETPGTVTILRW